MLKKALKRPVEERTGNSDQRVKRVTRTVKRKSALGDKTAKDEAEEILEKVVLGDDGEALEQIALRNVHSKQKDTSFADWSSVSLYIQY